MVMLGGMTLAQLSFASPHSQSPAHSQANSGTDDSAGDLPALPPVPQGVSTILGGEIQDVDPVLDQFSLHIYGQRPMEIVFDPRTQVYRNGIRIPLSELGNDSHASVQTVLDGSKVFAISIRVLTQAPEGDCEGMVESYNPGSGELTVNSTLSAQPVHFFVSPGTPIARVGEHRFTSAPSGTVDLVRGAFVSVNFAPGQAGWDEANRIAILAVPGSSFVFGGNISYLDLHAGLLVLVDPRDGKSYQISFNPARFAVSANLHIYDNVRVIASYDGTRYVASAITLN